MIMRCSLFAAVFAVLLSPQVFAADIWVAPAPLGADTNPGTQDKPLSSLHLALRKVRDLRRTGDASIAGGAQIILRGGTHVLDQTLFIRPEDSGTAASPTTIAAAPGERPVLSGGVALTGWKRLEQPLRGLPAEAQSHVWISEAPSFNGRVLETRQLWHGGTKATRAREPNDGKMLRLQSWDRKAQTAGIEANTLRGVTHPERLELFVQQQWETAVLRARSISVEQERALIQFHQPESRIEFEHPWPQPILPPEGAGAFVLCNAIEFLDQPGEWFQLADGRIVYWPENDKGPQPGDLVAPALETLVQVLGTLERPVCHVHLRGLQFQHTGWLRPSLVGHVPLQLGLYFLDAYSLRPPGTADWHKLDNVAWVGRPPAAVTVTAARNVTIEGCRFEHLAMNGVDLVRAVQDSQVQGCWFSDIGANAIFLGAFSDDAIEVHEPYDPTDEREFCARLRIANNVIRDAANEDYGCAAIALGFAQSVAVEHNDISDVSYTAINVGWGWTRTQTFARNHRIHANLLTRISTRMCDSAGIYTLSAQPGTVISENVVTQIKMSPYVDRPDHWFYLYLDEGSSFIQVRDNWCAEEKFLKNANGPGNLWENNGPGVSPEIRQRAGLEPAYAKMLLAP